MLSKLPKGYSMTETIWEVSGLVWIRKHTRFVHGVFHDLRPCGRGQDGCFPCGCGWYLPGICCR